MGISYDLGLDNSINNSYSSSSFTENALGIGGLLVGGYDAYNKIKVAKEQNRLAREAFEFNKDSVMKDFNLRLADRKRALDRRSNINANYDNLLERTGKDNRATGNKQVDYNLQVNAYDLPGNNTVKKTATPTVNEKTGQKASTRKPNANKASFLKQRTQATRRNDQRSTR